MERGLSTIIRKGKGVCIMDKTPDRITSVQAIEILDSRGNPTLKVKVTLENDAIGEASVPSGASTGSFEAHEKRDGGKRYNGKGVTLAAENVNDKIAEALVGLSSRNINEIDAVMIAADATENKSKLGANALLGVSMACARAAAASRKTGLYRYLGGEFAHIMPIPLMNILNGGAHADNNIDIQEFMIMPVGAPNFCEALRWGSEIHHALGCILRERELSCAVGDEGGFAPNLSDDEQAIELILTAIMAAGFNTDNIKIALDAAASEWGFSAGSYLAPKRKAKYTTAQLCEHWAKLCSDYPILSLEDGLDENDWQGWRLLTEKIGKKVQLVGDDLFVTNKERIARGIQENIANAVLIKPNQIGTLSETLSAVSLAQACGYAAVISHRSGETDDAFIADLAVAVNAGQIKAGAPCRGERVAKYNRLLEIEQELGSSAVYGTCF